MGKMWIFRQENLEVTNIFIGGKSGSAQSTAFWGVPGSSFPKSNSTKKTPPAKPIKKTGK